MIRQVRSGPERECAAAILAGGQNRRMGKNKALVEIGGQTLLELTLARLRPLFPEVILIAHDLPAYAPFEVPVFPDLLPGNGSLGGLHTALARARTPRVFCLACDMPFLRPEVVLHLVHLAREGYDAVIPSLELGLEPLCAVYAKSLAPALEARLREGERKISRALAGARVRFVEAGELRPFDGELLSFFNINTPDDLDRARELAPVRR